MNTLNRIKNALSKLRNTKKSAPAPTKQKRMIPLYIVRPELALFTKYKLSKDQSRKFVIAFLHYERNSKRYAQRLINEVRKGLNLQNEMEETVYKNYVDKLKVVGLEMSDPVIWKILGKKK